MEEMENVTENEAEWAGRAVSMITIKGPMSLTRVSYAIGYADQVGLVGRDTRKAKILLDYWVERKVLRRYNKKGVEVYDVAEEDKHGLWL